MRKLFILLSILLIFGSGKVSAASGAQAKAYNTFISNGYFNGLSPNININDYSGSKKITRVEFIALLNNLYKLGGASDIRFVDVMPGNWFYDDVMVAVGNNYADGYAEAVFLPMGELTREQAIVMCARFLGLETREGKKTIFMDDNQISDWGKKYISAMYDNGYLDTFENPNLFPKNSLSWDEALNFLMDIYGQPREVADAVALDAGGMVRGSHDLVYRAKPTGGDRAQRQTIHQNDDGVTRRNIDDILEDEQYRYNNVRRVVSDEGVLSESEERGYAVSRDPEEAVSEKVGKYIEKGYIDEGRAGEEYADEIYEKEYTDEEYADEEYIEEEYTDEEYADEGYEKEYTDEEYADEEYIEEEYTDKEEYVDDGYEEEGNWRALGSNLIEENETVTKINDGYPEDAQPMEGENGTKEKPIAQNLNKQSTEVNIIDNMNQLKNLLEPIKKININNNLNNSDNLIHSKNVIIGGEETIEHDNQENLQNGYLSENDMGEGGSEIVAWDYKNEGDGYAPGSVVRHLGKVWVQSGNPELSNGEPGEESAWIEIGVDNGYKPEAWDPLRQSVRGYLPNTRVSLNGKIYEQNYTSRIYSGIPGVDKYWNKVEEGGNKKSYPEWSLESQSLQGYAFGSKVYHEGKLYIQTDEDTTWAGEPGKDRPWVLINGEQ